MDQSNVGDLSSIYGRRQYSADDLQRMADANGQSLMMGIVNTEAMDESSMAGGQSLDEIINQNNKELERRRSYQQQFPAPRANQGEGLRRPSMLEFGSGSGSDLEGFQFDPPPLLNSHGLPHTAGIAQRRLNSQRAQSQASMGSLGLNTQFQSLGSGFNPMTETSPYQQPFSSAHPINMDVSRGYIPDMDMGLTFSSGDIEQNNGRDDVAAMNLYSQSTFVPDLTSSPLKEDMPDDIRGPLPSSCGVALVSGEERDLMDKMPNMQMSDQLQNIQTNAGRPSMAAQEMSPIIPLHDAAGVKPAPYVLAQQSAKLRTPVRSHRNNFTTAGPVETVDGQATVPQYRNAYSSSGFDMLGVLMRVATRKDPQINIGAVDMSCAFVVCDITQHDLPIVYCSDMFERLTGYTKHEILGRNCRFLQAPDGKVQSGTKRKYVDDHSVLHLKNMINDRQEAQISVINYRKGGQPFMNLLTIIPIPYDTDEMKYYVGFQVDLVEQPTSITNKNPDGSYSINYQRDRLPTYVFQSPENHLRDPELVQTIGRDEVSTVLSTIGTGESELSRRIWDKVLLENTDDVVHVLSLKGLFLYLSPSSRKVLEYDPSELVGTALSSVCHPSDIVPVTRELKDTSSGTVVNVVFRIRRKHNGYTWFESHGSLHTEQGKGKKCIILVGRERPVYALSRGDIVSEGGIGESELWTKMSTSGMFLFVSSNVRTVLDRTPDELLGTSAQALMRSESKFEFGRMLELARTGSRATFKHDVHNKRGQTMQAQTTIYPGDAVEGQKPTFLVAQTKFLKATRATPAVQKQVTGQSPQAGQNSARSDTPSTGSGGTPMSRRASTPQSSPSNPYHVGVVTQPGGRGLAIGSQHEALASENNVFDELKTTRSTSWQFELRQMEKRNRILAEELQSLLASKKKRKRVRGAGQLQKDCANCHTRVTPEWRRGPSGNRDLCNSCGLRWAKQSGRVSPRTTSQHSDRHSGSDVQISPLATTDQRNHFDAAEKKPAQASNAESHKAKLLHMETVAPPGYGGGIPSKIEETDESMDKIAGSRAL